MRRHALWSMGAWVTFSYGTPHFEFRQLNSSLSLSSSSPTVSDSASYPPSSSTLSSSLDFSISSILLDADTTSITSIYASVSSIKIPPIDLSPTDSADIDQSSTVSLPANSTTFTLSGPTQTSQSNANFTSIATTNASDSAPAICTGCVLEAIWPTTITADQSMTVWEDIKVTITVLNRTVTYMDGTNIDTVVTEFETLTQNLTGPGTQTDVHTTLPTTPIFTWVPFPGTTLTLEAGPTYVAYTDIWGGLDFPWGSPTPTETWPIETDIHTPPPCLPWEECIFRRQKLEPEETCNAQIDLLPAWPTATEDYEYYIQTFIGPAPTDSPGFPISLPPALIEHLKSHPFITPIFNGSDIASCTLRETTRKPAPPLPPSFSATVPLITGTPPVESGEPISTRPSSPPGFKRPTTSTYISKTYESTSTHVTRQGCLRCLPPTSGSEMSNGIAEPSQKPKNPPAGPPASKQQATSQIPPASRQPPASPPKNPQQTQGEPIRQRPTDLVGIIVSVINDPAFTPKPQPQPDKNQHITIGNSVIQIRPAQPTNPSQPDKPNQQQPQNPGVVIGSETLTLGQTTTINGVQVIVPTRGGGSSIIVGGTPIPVNQNPGPTGPPILTLGDTTLTANPEGQFIVGNSQTLVPGGPPITADGTTVSLGPSGSIAVINGVTQTLMNAAVLPTGAPVLTANGQVISATVLGGTTQFVLAPRQTLTPGGVLTIDGTTFSLPASASGSIIVVNGVTSTLNVPDNGLPVLTFGTLSLTASITDGTTAFILAPGQTLTPGGVLTVGGTTFSMPLSASGSIVVINGITSTLKAPASNTASTTSTASGEESSTSTQREPGNFIASGIGSSDKPGGAGSARRAGLEKWVEGIVVGLAGWMVVLF